MAILKFWYHLNLVQLKPGPGPRGIIWRLPLAYLRSGPSAINRAKYPPPILYPSYTLTSPFNTPRLLVINTVKPKLLSVFKVAPRQAISAAVLRLPKVRTPLVLHIRRLWAHGPKRYFAVLPFEIRHWHIKFASDHTLLVGRETQPSVSTLIK